MKLTLLRGSVQRLPAPSSYFQNYSNTHKRLNHRFIRRAEDSPGQLVKSIKQSFLFPSSSSSSSFSFSSHRRRDRDLKNRGPVSDFTISSPLPPPSQPTYDAGIPINATTLRDHKGISLAFLTPSRIVIGRHLYVRRHHSRATGLTLSPCPGACNFNGTPGNR